MLGVGLLPLRARPRRAHPVQPVGHADAVNAYAHSTLIFHIRHVYGPSSRTAAYGSGSSFSSRLMALVDLFFWAHGPGRSF
ncbi:hypothetical protein EVAR_88646_1 [Eumeta japonica]|uniref:Uncharacterized protein n=1 Tax=Eumeta variegata TaxID=151549 RepID=A0A4C1X404_EUMVA|nr:hypothetical protein EVAR_88646_1 [Eumeta japonica]